MGSVVIVAQPGRASADIHADADLIEQVKRTPELFTAIFDRHYQRIYAYVAGRLGRPLYDPADPHAAHRPLDDTRFTLDHFHTKLLKLSSGFQTPTGARLAALRHARPQRFVDEFSDEI